VIDLLKAIHASWAADGGLIAKLSAAKVFTGPAKAATPPWCAVTVESRETVLRDNTGLSVDKIAVRFTVADTDHDRGAKLIAEIRQTFDRSTFAAGSGATCIVILRGAETETSPEAGSPWLFTLDFECRVSIAAGA
jgi:hypothetical protein